MYCTSCSEKINKEINFCANCGTPTRESTSNVSETEKNKSVKLEGDTLKVGYTNTVSNAIKKIFFAALIAITIGAISYPISNEVQGINKTNLSPSDYPFQLKIGANNDAIRRNYIESKSMENAKMVTIITFIFAIGYFFIKVEKVDKKSDLGSE